MHFLVDRRPVNKSGTIYRTRCGQTRSTKTADISAWGSDITCPGCLP